MQDRSQVTLWFLLLLTLLWSGSMEIETRSYSSGTSRGSALCSYVSRNPIVDLELASTPACFQSILELDKSGAQENAKIVRTNTRMDFLFIALYATVFVLIARVYSGSWPYAVIVFISVTALFDCLENYRILQGVHQYLGSSLVVGPTPQTFSRVKWVALGLALLCLGKVFWNQSNLFSRVHASVAGLAGILTIPAAWSPSFLKVAVFAFAAVFLLALVRYFPFTWDEVVVFLEYSYLIRFQITAGVLLAVGLPLGYFAVPSVFQGLFDGRGFWSFVFIVWAAFQLAWTIMITCRLVFVYGPERFGRAKSLHVSPVGAKTVVLFALLAVPPVYVLSKQTILPHPFEKVLGIALGILMALLVLMATAAMHFAIEPEESSSANAIFPSFGFLSSTLPGISPPRVWTYARNLLIRLPCDLTAGIVKDGRIHSGHEMATIAFLLFFLLYVSVGILYRPTWVSPEEQPAALFFLLFLLTVLTWFLSGAAFTLDRFRLPVFATLLGASLLMGAIRTDHEFCVTLTTPMESLPASTVIDRWIQGDRRKGSNKIIVVATAGGGIRAAAWTTEVLTHLQRDCRERMSSSVLLISSVSGGSVGTMFAVAPFVAKDGSFPDDEEHLKDINFNASRSSLSAVGWGLLYPDLARTTPFVGTVFVPQWFDRGWSLQNAWVTGWRKKDFSGPTMAEWRKDVARGVRPAVIFNATASESGERFLTASTDLSRTTAVQFFEEFRDWDLPVATAARLSATFPYVSPEARPSDGPQEKRYHVADGGYYDNSGLLSAIEWLQDAWEDQDTRKQLESFTVLLVVIDAKSGPPANGKSWSWQTQVVSPIETLLHVRSSSQVVRDDLELKMAIAYLRAKGMSIAEPAKFLYDPEPGLAVPLSWHLTKAQLDSVERNWSKQASVTADFYKQLGCTVQ